MSNSRKHGEQSGRTVGSDSAVEALLGRADPRPAPPAADEAAVRVAVHAEWNRVTGPRRRRRRMLAYGLAASFTIALIAGLQALNIAGDAGLGRTVATVEKQFGQIRVSDAGEVPTVIAAGPILGGQTVETGEDSGLALSWGRGGSVRLGANSRVRMESATVVELIAGRLYYDSVSDPMTRLAPRAGSARILVETPHGTLRHIGTQFVAELNAQELHVLVREGAVRLELETVRETAAAGQLVRVQAGREPRFSAVDGAGSEWRWVERLAPSVDLDGHSAFDALRWVARETGQRIGYASRSAEQAARRAELQGLGSLEPSLALRFILLAADLESAEENGAIVVREK